MSEKESFGTREEDYLLTSLSLTHHFVVDDDHDNGGEEECDPFDQIKRKKKERKKAKYGEKMSHLTDIVCGLSMRTT